MNKRVLKLSAAAIVGVFALSACGNNGSGDPTNGATSAGGDTPAAVDPANLETTISILAPSYSDSSQADWQKIIDKFNETYPKVMAAADVEVKGLIVSLNRMEVGKGGKVTAQQEIQEKYGFPVASIVSMAEVKECLHNHEVAGRIVIDDDIAAAIDAYYEQWGAKE